MNKQITEEQLKKGKKALTTLKLSKVTSTSHGAIIDNEEIFNQLIKTLEEIFGWNQEDENEYKKHKEELKNKAAEGKPEDWRKNTIKYVENFWNKNQKTIKTGAKVAGAAFALYAGIKIAKKLLTNKANKKAEK